MQVTSLYVFTDDDVDVNGVVGVGVVVGGRECVLCMPFPRQASAAKHSHHVSESSDGTGGGGGG